MAVDASVIEAMRTRSSTGRVSIFALSARWCTLTGISVSLTGVGREDGARRNTALVKLASISWYAIVGETDFG